MGYQTTREYEKCYVDPCTPWCLLILKPLDLICGYSNAPRGLYRKPYKFDPTINIILRGCKVFNQAYNVSARLLASMDDVVRMARQQIVYFVMHSEVANKWSGS